MSADGPQGSVSEARRCATGYRPGRLPISARGKTSPQNHLLVGHRSVLSGPSSRSPAPSAQLAPTQGEVFPPRRLRTFFAFARYQRKASGVTACPLSHLPPGAVTSTALPPRQPPPIPIPSHARTLAPTFRWPSSLAPRNMTPRTPAAHRTTPRHPRPHCALRAPRTLPWLVPSGT